ncbi:MAG TPA: enolase C-terminal domain-like protein [Candidatus Nanoarchaeia archaeon]|nr:enolase C-terminal domain-like protein [Candidatus Nanoarchaeia archaeon]
MQIKEVEASRILDSRKKETILISVKSGKAVFNASSPSGTSTGRHEAKPYKTTLNSDIRVINQNSKKLSQLTARLKDFDDLSVVEGLIKGKIGANTLYALETAILKAAASSYGVELWQLINRNAGSRKKMPMPVGNVVGGGMHAAVGKSIDFQEFLFIPQTGKFCRAYALNLAAYKMTEKLLQEYDDSFEGKKDMENAFITSLDDEAVLSVMNDVKKSLEKSPAKSKIRIGVDVAASSFFKNRKYFYKSKSKSLGRSGQIDYVSYLAKKYNIFYIEDPLSEDDFNGFAVLRKKAKNSSLIVGDDLTTTNPARLKKAIKAQAINAIIVKPNQIGSLLEVRQVCEIARKNRIKIIFSHRSGETTDSTIADLAFAFQADYIKTGIAGKERQVKLKRLVEIEKSV